MKKIITIAAILFAILQTKAQTHISMGGVANYHFATSSQKSATTPFLFLSNAQSAGAEVLFTKQKSKLAFKITAEYITGNNAKDAPAVYAKQKDIVYTKYNYTKSKPSGLTVLAGPRLILLQNLNCQECI